MTSQPAGTPTIAGTATATPSAGAPGSTPPTVEVTGIVGSVNVRTQSIQIERRSGADVTRITVQPSTVLRKATGGTTSLADIRPSDRVIARGTITSRGGELLADEVTVQQVLPGASPSG